MKAWHGWVAITSVLLAAACNEQPVEPATDVSRSIDPAAVETDQVPEEEILGTVFFDRQVNREAVEGLSVKLTEADNDACIFALNPDGTPGGCVGWQTMAIMPGGSRPPKETTIMWGWFDDLDNDNNPCKRNRKAETPFHERHDLDQNGLADDGLNPDGSLKLAEQHCIRTGRYTVELGIFPAQGVVPAGETLTRTVDHQRTDRVSLAGIIRNVEDASGREAHDTFVHFDVGTGAATWPVKNNVLAIDNPETSVEFDPGDLVTRVGVQMRFDSRARSFVGAPAGALMYRVYFDAGRNDNIRSEHWNPDLVIRTHAFLEADLFSTQAEVIHPKSTADAGVFSPKKTVDVRPATTATVATVSVTPSSASILVGGSVTLTATPRDASGNPVSGKVVEWSTSNASVASIAPTSGTVTVTGQSQGTATIQAKVDGVPGTATITVSITDPEPAQVASVEVTPSSAPVEVGQSVTFTATPRDAAGNPLPDRIVTWSTSNSAVASIAPSGNTVTVTGKSLGSATIQAEIEGVPPDNATVNVTLQPVASVEVLPSTISIQVGQTEVAAARLRAADGTILTGRTVTWTTSNAAVASIDPVASNSVIVIGQGVGSATVTASIEGKSGATSVSVTAPVDQATAAGHTFPGGMLSGGIASVSLWMQNSGTTTWSAGGGYQLELVRDVAEWLPSSVGVPGSVGPGATASFFFDLRHIQPGMTGFVPAFFRMARQGARFGGENGADILLSSDGCIECGGLQAETTTLEVDPTTTWLVGAVEGGTGPLALDGAALRGQGAAQVEYAFAHDAPRQLDIVLRFTYDPTVLRPARSQTGPGGAALARSTGLRGAGTYWVRLTGTVPAGRGRIVAFPFQLVEGAEASGELGTLTIYYPRP